MAASTKKVFTIGLTSLEAGACDTVYGEMPSSGMSTHGNVYRDTMNIETSDPTFNDFFEEEITLPAETEEEPGETNISFEILRPSVADLVFWCGGTAEDVETDDGRKWKAPVSFVSQELALRVNSKQGYKMEFPRGRYLGTPTGGGQKSTPMRIKVSGKLLVPSGKTSAQVETVIDKSPMIFTEPAASA